MKTKIFTFLVVLIGGLFMATSAFAVDETLVSKGSTNTYNVTLGNGNATGVKYAWSILPASGWTATLGNTNENSIKWNTAGVYTITVIATDGNGCLSEPLTRTVTVSDSEWNLAGETNLQTCSNIVAGNGNNQTTALADNTIFNVNITNPLSAASYTVNYTVSDGTTTDTRQVTAYTAGASITIDHQDNANITSIFTNTTNLDKTVTVSVTSVVDQNGSNVTEVTTPDHSYTITVYPKATISF